MSASTVCPRLSGSFPLKELRHRGLHLAVDALGELGVEDRAVVAAGDDLDDGVALERGERILEELDGPFEVEGIHAAGDHVELALELGADGGPVPLEDE